MIAELVRLAVQEYCVRHDILQSLTEEQKATARQNIGAAVGDAAVSDAPVRVFVGDTEVGQFTLNQATDAEIRIPARSEPSNARVSVKNGSAILGSFTLNQAADAELDLQYPQVWDSTVTLKSGDREIGFFTTNQSQGKVIDLQYPVVNDTKVVFVNSDGVELGTFTLNQALTEGSDDIRIEIPTAERESVGTVEIYCGGQKLGGFTALSSATISVPAPESSGNGRVTVKYGDQVKGEFTMNQADPATVVIPQSGAGTLTVNCAGEQHTFRPDQNQDVTIDIPDPKETDDPGDGRITFYYGREVSDDESRKLGQFSANQKDDTTIVIPEPSFPSPVEPTEETPAGVAADARWVLKQLNKKLDKGESDVLTHDLTLAYGYALKLSNDGCIYFGSTASTSAAFRVPMEDPERPGEVLPNAYHVIKLPAADGTLALDDGRGDPGVYLRAFGTTFSIEFKTETLDMSITMAADKFAEMCKKYADADITVTTSPWDEAYVTKLTSGENA